MVVEDQPKGAQPNAFDTSTCTPANNETKTPNKPKYKQKRKGSFENENNASPARLTNLPNDILGFPACLFFV